MTMEQFAELFEKLERAIEPHRERLEIAAMVSEYGTSRRRSWQARASLRLYLTQDEEAERPTSEIKEEVRSLLPEHPGVTYRLERLRHWSGDQDIGVELSGRDSALLAAVAVDVQDRLSRVGGLADVDTNLEDGDEEVRIVVGRTQASAAGVTPLAVARAVGSALGERPIAKYRTSDREIDILLSFRGSQRASLEDLREVEVVGDDGRLVPLMTIASFERALGPRMLRR